MTINTPTTFTPTPATRTPTPGASPSTATGGLDFNDALPATDFTLIPPGTIAKVILRLQPGGYRDPARGWEDGYASCNPATGSVYLKCEYTVQEGPFQGRKVWGLIGLYSPKGTAWAQQGRTFIRSLLSAARGFGERDTSPGAIAARHIGSYGDLDGLSFTARIEVESHSETGQAKNVIGRIVPVSPAGRPSEKSVYDGKPVPGKPASHGPHWSY